MTDAEKINIIDKIIGTAFELAPERDAKAGYYEGIVSAIVAVLECEKEEHVNV